MYVIPAIDLLGGRCVRLVQGEYNRYINYEDDPAKKAVEFKQAGAEWLHIIDLDGAKIGKCVNIDAIRDIVQSAKGLKIQVGGGIRDRDTITKILEMGTARVILGTKAVSDFEWFSEVVKEFAGKIVLSLDARGTRIATDGWEKDSSHELLDFAKKAAQLPLDAIIYTDINKDGMLSGPNIDRTKVLAEAISLPVIAAGGVTTIEDIRKLAETKVISAAIVGRALYEGTLNLADAIKVCSKND
ncbi:MAG: 1-(5-phosphoribosyl)-5-[(5-phosphoribosylamino)methylideneamino]imidazole-4-carboxamide isomerase [Planctomycetes bacterium]|nr:1-(5-phosphoribosyl)-5-[(5-phosphoribosylamino)methylideneamino]imidazole-4-carboxamide isomerase [Planctomycetota bacterium]MBU1518198.1 1-(5-phosphoribosyl)-5-[(5-phosphoribosylamino)methylideneamino]imidazole-4-carboxamide isomerase [Planctomycetota bacterium]MBU2596563.1 1-(5-phosphoribosyl)-5-[(5-phosphoribosylamino)methylideneamino]imidazole-4-carboxamide isomerase [Planctomycetota bacterium]